MCKIEKSKESFSQKRGACKECRTSISKDDYKKKRLAEREIKRKEFFKIIEQRCKEEGVEFDFRKIFIEEELLALMRLKPEYYSFCEVPYEIEKDFKKTDDYNYLKTKILSKEEIKNFLKKNNIVK